MKRILSLALLCLCTIGVAHAEIYSWKDAEGNVVYSDQKPPPGVSSHKVELQPLPTVPATVPPPSTGAGDQGANPAPATRSVLKIVSPKNEEALRANNGDITIDLQASPALTSNQVIQVYVDGKMVSAGHSLSVHLRNLDRGQHQAYAVLADGSGQVVRRSESVTFYVLRHSVLFKKPKAPAP